MIAAYPWIERKIDEVTRGDFLDRLPHAMLIDTLPYWGAEELACRLAQKILNIDSDPRESPHPDVLWIKPETGKLKIEHIRDAIEFVHLSSQLAGRKVTVLESIEQATIPASNALLKSLEEPPSKVHWILTTNAYDVLLPTIRSRCARIHLPNPADDEIEQWLTDQGVSSDELNNLMIEFGSAPFAIKNASDLNQQSLRQYLIQGWRDPSVDLAIAKELKDQDFNELLVRWMRITARIVHNESAEEPFHFWDELVATRRAVHDQTNLNRQVHIERLLIQWFRMKQKMRRRKAKQRMMQH